MVAKARVKVPSFKKKSVSKVSTSLRVSKRLFFVKNRFVVERKKKQINFSFSVQTKNILFVT
jgi:hypothetical protein